MLPFSHVIFFPRRRRDSGSASAAHKFGDAMLRQFPLSAENIASSVAEEKQREKKERRPRKGKRKGRRTGEI